MTIEKRLEQIEERRAELETERLECTCPQSYGDMLAETSYELMALDIEEDRLWAELDLYYSVA